MDLLKQPEAARGLPAFTNCVRAFEEELDYLTRCLRRHGVSPVDAEDLVQDVFVVMCRRWADFRPGRPLRPWLAGIAFHVAKSHLRRHGREVLKSDIDLEDGRPVAEDRLMSEGARKLVLKVLASLPERHRSALIMHDLDEMAVPEIAQTLGIPLASAYTRIRRARIAFAEGLKRHEELPLPGDQVRRGAGLGIEALFAIERKPPGVAAAFRQRALARARAVATEAAAGRWPDASGAGAVRTSTIARLAEGAGLATLLGAAAFFVWMLARSPAAQVDPSGGEANRAVALTVPPAGPRWASAALAASTRPSAVPRLIEAVPGAPGATLGVGLGSYWRLDDGHGSLVARDASGHGNDCRLIRGKPELGWVDAPRGGGLSLGPGGWLECQQPSTPALTGAEVSAALWIRIDKLRKYHGTLAVRQLISGAEDLFYFGILQSDLVLYSAVWQPARIAARIENPIGRWIHVAFTRRRDGLTKLYINGVVAAEEQAEALASGPAPGPLLVGAAFKRPRHNRDVIKRFQGAIDEIMVYERALSDDEVATIASGIGPSSPGQLGPIGAN
jgi:RNA polymerase sigma factor (sigma-70 family)